jgi:predicted transcriptional regulator
MATITLQYNARNSFAKKTIEYVLSLGIFEQQQALSGIEEGLDDIKKGRVITIKDPKNVIKECLK